MRVNKFGEDLHNLFTHFWVTSKRLRADIRPSGSRSYQPHGDCCDGGFHLKLGSITFEAPGGCDRSPSAEPQICCFGDCVINVILTRREFFANGKYVAMATAPTAERPNIAVMSKVTST